MKKTTALLLVFLLSLFVTNAIPSETDGRFAFVPSEGDNNVMIVDLINERTVKTLPTGKTPHALVFTKEGKGYVNNRGTRDLTVIDGNTFELIKTIPLPATSFQLALSPDGKLLYAVNETTKTGTSVTLIDANTDNVVKDIPIPLEAGETGLGHHGEFTRDGKFFFVCNEGGRTVAVIDTAKMEVIKTLRAGMGAGHPAMTRDGKYIFVIHHKDNVVAVIDTASQEVIKDISVGTGKKQAHGSYFPPDGRYLYYDQCRGQHAG